MTRIEPHKYGSYLFVASDELRAAGSLGELIRRSLDRRFNPWKFPDPNPFPTFVLFPRVAAVAASGRRLKMWPGLWRERIPAAIAVLRHGAPEGEM